MIIRVRPSSLNKNKTKLWRGNYKAKILDSKIRSSHALSKSALPDTDHDNVGKKYNSTFHGGNSTRPLADRDTGRQAVMMIISDWSSRYPGSAPWSAIKNQLNACKMP